MLLIDFQTKTLYTMKNLITLFVFLFLLGASPLFAQAGSSPCNAVDLNFLPNPCDTTNSFLLPPVANTTTQVDAALPCYTQNLTQDVWVKFTVPNYTSAGVRLKMYSASDSLGYALYESPTDLCSNLELLQCAIAKGNISPLGGDRENGRFAFYFRPESNSNPTLNLTIGKTYWVRMWETLPQPQGMTFKTGVIALNDNCADAFALEGYSCNYGASSTLEPNAWTPAYQSPPFTCQTGQWGSNDNPIWYKFEITAATPQPVTIRLGQVVCYDGFAQLQMAVWTNNNQNCDLFQETLMDCAIAVDSVIMRDMNLPIGNYFLLIDGSAGAQCGFQIESAQLISSLLNDGPNCPGDTVKIKANNTQRVGSTYNYVFSGGNLGGNINTGTLNNLAIANPVAGTYTVTVTETNMQGTVSSVTATTVVSISPAPNPTSLPIISLRCGNGCGNIDAGNGLGTYNQWRWSNGDNTRIARACTQGVYTVTVTNGYGCSASGTTTVDSLLVMFDFASENQYANCERRNGRIQVDNVIGGAQSGLKYWVGTMADSTNAQYSNILTGIASDTPITVWAIDTAGCTAFTSVTIRNAADVITLPTLTATTNYADCEGKNGQIVITNVQNGGGAVWQYWSDNNSAAAQYSTTISGIDAGVHTAWVSDTLKCKGSTTVTVLRADDVLPKPEITFHTQIADCDGKNGVIFIDGVQGGAGAPFSFTFNGVPQAANDSLIFRGLNFGKYAVFMSDSLKCKDTIQAELPRKYYPEATYAPAKSPILVDGSTTLVRTVTKGQIIRQTWTDTNDLSCQNCKEPVASPFQTATYAVTMTDNNGCTITRTVTVVVESKTDVYAPNIITPNSDGTNDVFMLYAGRSLVKIKRLQIFNRWGAMLYENNDYDPLDLTDGWDGTYKGVSLEPDVFVWRAEVEYSDGRTRILEGDVAIVR
jgi:gliding motility-associated-like protein